MTDLKHKKVFFCKKTSFSQGEAAVFKRKDLFFPLRGYNRCPYSDSRIFMTSVMTSNIRSPAPNKKRPSVRVRTIMKIWFFGQFLTMAHTRS